MKITNEQIEEARLIAALRGWNGSLPGPGEARACAKIGEAALIDLLGDRAAGLGSEILGSASWPRLVVHGVPRALGSVPIFELIDRLFPGHAFEVVVTFSRKR